MNSKPLQRMCTSIRKIFNKDCDAIPSEPDLPLPDGISEEDLLAFLKSVRHSNESAPDEVIEYCQVHFKRFLLTYDLIRDAEGKCLELGSNPHFMTIILRQFTNLELTLSNFFHPNNERGKTIPVELLYDNRNWKTMYYDFNVEEDQFPFVDAQFDVVLFCEMIEHLQRDPCFALKEIRRVLKQDGTLILTTPNVNKLLNIQKLISGQNIYDHYSFHGPYGRHNREYNIYELKILLEYCGFAIEKAFTDDVYNNEISNSKGILKHLLLSKDELGQVIFIKARAQKKAGLKRPAFLYASYPEMDIDNYP